MNDRLTARNHAGLAYLVNVKPNEQEVESPHKNTLKCILDCFERLAQYEDAEQARETGCNTNADRIRSMSDEELAAILVAESLAEKIPFCQNKAECGEIILDTADGTIPEEMCLKCALDWLRQPAKEATHE